MQHIFSYIDQLGDFFASRNNWVYRYQGLIIGFIALTIAYNQMRIARRQNSISSEQHQLSKSQRQTEIALAVVAIEPFLAGALKNLDLCIACVYHQDTGEKNGSWTIWTWNPEALTSFTSVKVPDGIEGYAAKAYPDDAPALSRLGRLVTEAQLLASEYERSPWTNPAIREEQGAGRDDQMTRRADEALNGIFVASNECSKLQAHGQKAPTTISS
jgi:hypothetical protein